MASRKRSTAQQTRTAREKLGGHTNAQTMSLAPNRRPIVICFIMASMSMVALEATIVATAMPKIVAQLGGIELYSWVFSAFLLTQTATTVVFGKLADIYGRKPTILLGVSLFVFASALAGMAHSMEAMIVYRLIQGIGAGAIMPVTLTIVGDMYPAHERGKVQGYLASVWAASAVLGPLAGSVIVQHWSWSWIFWVNIPIGIAAAVGFAIFLREDRRSNAARPDILGAALFTVVIAALMVSLAALGEGAYLRASLSGAVFVLGALAFAWQERRAADPMLSFQLWTTRPIAACNLATLFSGMAMMGLTTFVPMFVQIVLGKSPTVAGFALTMMMVGWPTGATLASKLFMRVGLRRQLMVGSVFVPAGALVFVFLTPESSAVLAGIGSAVLGFGMGVLSVSSLILIQDSVPSSERGSATASNIFSRNLGNTLGAALLGVVQAAAFTTQSSSTVSLREVRQLLEGSQQHVSSFLGVRSAMHYSLHITFSAMFGLAVLASVAMLLLPRRPSANAH